MTSSRSLSRRPVLRAGDIVATVYKDSSGSALYVEPLPPQSLTCLGQFRLARSAARWTGLVRFREHHASAASRRRVVLPQPRPRPNWSLSWDTWRR